jgi:beta-glucosidase
MTNDLRFPPGFIWGVATAAHQVEGGTTNNQWYAWEDQGGIATGERAGLASDWWAHAEADFDRAKDMGINGLRLSLEWSRIEPEENHWDDAAIARYRAMLQGLRARDIEPMVTLHHFTTPLWLDRRGGFATDAAIPLFARFVGRCVAAFGDLCDFWCTINELNVYATLGYITGIFPPGHKGDARTAVRVQGTLLRAHAAAYRALHDAQPAARVGLAHAMQIFDPAANRPQDRFVAYWQDAGFNGIVIDALARGRARGPIGLLTGDLSGVRGTFDYMGLNYYTRELVAFDLGKAAELFGRRFTAPGAERQDQGASGGLGGEIYPDGLRRLLLRLNALGRPLYVTENGTADAADTRRPSALVRTLVAAHRAIDQGADLRGYYHWSLVDNFEWAEGWSARFGLIGLDPTTQERTTRESANVYARICHADAIPADVLERYGQGPHSTSG